MAPLPSGDGTGYSTAATVAVIMFEWFSSVKEIGRQRWEACTNGLLYPFARYDFHLALEENHCIDGESGWDPHYLLIKDDKGIAQGIAPIYRKLHSQGEFVFDWSWADAYQRYGYPYYPKLIWAIPFSPVTGPRLFCRSDHPDQDALYLQASLAIDARAQELSCSGWHLLFAKKEHLTLLSGDDRLHRIACQFHWFNRTYRDMDDYFSSFASRKRKAVRKEREKVSAQSVSLVRLSGDQLTQEDIAFFYLCYQSTYAKRGMWGYLSQSFFEQLSQTMGDQIMLVMAYRHGERIAASWCFYDDNTLYGRYWGAAEDIDCLHFEACYYQGIEFCLERGIQRYDPGTQGEHKISRGFEPVFSHSLHYIDHPAFRDAIQRFCQEEAVAVKDYREQIQKLVPFKKEAL